MRRLLSSRSQYVNKFSFMIFCVSSVSHKYFQYFVLLLTWIIAWLYINKKYILLRIESTARNLSPYMFNDQNFTASRLGVKFLFSSCFKSIHNTTLPLVTCGLKKKYFPVHYLSQGRISTHVAYFVFLSGAHLDGHGVPAFLLSFPIYGGGAGQEPCISILPPFYARGLSLCSRIDIR